MAPIQFAALKNQLMRAGLNRYLPFSTVGQMGATPYLFRSGFNGGIALADDCRGADYPREQLRQAIAEGRRIRPYWFGNFYPLSDAYNAHTSSVSSLEMIGWRDSDGDGVFDVLDVPNTLSGAGYGPGFGPIPLCRCIVGADPSQSEFVRTPE